MLWIAAPSRQSAQCARGNPSIHNARHALAYVLNNWRRHRVDWENGHGSPRKLDPFSSATSFSGWAERFVVPKAYEPLPVAPPRTALLRDDWLEFGRISPYEVPAPLQ